MGFVHMHQGILVIKGWGNPNYLLNYVNKIGVDQQKARKINQIVSQMPTLGPQHDKIQTQWALDIPSERMWKRV
jgi:hypothetical protein